MAAVRNCYYIRQIWKTGGAPTDIYQILTIHNRPWTGREIACFAALLLTAALLAFVLLRRRKIFWFQAAAGLALLVFLGIVFASTVFTRTPDGERKYCLELFWSWKKVFLENSQPLLKENLLNMILLFPMGLLLPVMCGKRLSWWKGFLSGAAVSAAIEICQLVFCRGLFEWDDMIHNGIGCMAGCLFGGIFADWFCRRAKKKYKCKRKKGTQS